MSQDSYRQILEVLSNKRRVFLTTHVRPDGDALGSVAAMAMGLRAKGIEVQVLLLSHLPGKYAFVFKENGINHVDVEQSWPADFSMDQYDALLVVDTGTWSQLPGLKEKLAGWSGAKLVVDHHLTQENWADVKLVVTEAAAAGEIVAELLGQWGVAMDTAIASALFLAIVSDTGWFQFSNTRPYTLRLAAQLIEAGVDTDRMYQLLYQNERAERVALQTRAQESLELLSDNRVAVMRLRRRDFELARANLSDTENLINIPLQIRTVEVAILLVEPLDGGPIRVSLRSKGTTDVARFAEIFGGGGHARASGLKLTGQLDEIHDRVVHALLDRLAWRSAR